VECRVVVLSTMKCLLQGIRCFSKTPQMHSDRVKLGELNMSSGAVALEKGKQILSLCRKGPSSQYIALLQGSQVRLHSMAAAIMNGAVCEVVEDCISQDRVAVRILSPHEAVAAYPQGAKIKRSNMTPVLPDEEDLQEWEQLVAFDAETRLAMCGAIVDDFMSACLQGSYPLEDQERIFGVVMHSHAAALPMEHRPIGSIVYLCWVDLIKSEEATRNSILHAILSSRLPQYFEDLVTGGEGNRCSAELIRRGFADIEWDHNFLRFIRGK
jgi:hypothetical protein